MLSISNVKITERQNSPLTGSYFVTGETRKGTPISAVLPVLRTPDIPVGKGIIVIESRNGKDCFVACLVGTGV